MAANSSGMDSFSLFVLNKNREIAAIVVVVSTYALVITFILYEVRRRKFSFRNYLFGDPSSKTKSGDKIELEDKEIQKAKPNQTLEESSNSSSETETTTESKNSSSSSYSKKEEKSK